MESSTTIRDLIVKVQAKRMAGMRMIMERKSEFPDMLSAQLTGIALDPAAREYAESFLDARLSIPQLSGYARTSRELVIGSGFHAATYVASRVMAGYQAPTILEASSRVGGTFAYPRAVFYLNSSTRKGDPGLSGDSMANLNYLPGAPIQASNIGTGQYQTNADIAFVIRLALAQWAERIAVNSPVVNVERRNGAYRVTTENGNAYTTGRIIDARGLGMPKDATLANGSTILTFPQFMDRMTGTWPLRGIKRAAVIGDGDSARCAVESLLGIAPQAFMAAAELDTVMRIDWYAQNVSNTFDNFCRSERGRYRGIGRFLRPDQYGQKRLNVFRTRAYTTALPQSKALIDGRSYDLVVLATGSKATQIEGLGEDDAYEVYATRERVRFNDPSIDPLARLNYNDSANSGGRFRIGPLADLPFSGTEISQGIDEIPNNRVAMFRLATKTAALAATLPGVDRPNVF